MKSTLSLSLALVFALNVLGFHFADAKSATEKSTKNSLVPSIAKASKSPGKKGKLSTDINFNDLLVRGKYQFSDSAVASVENEKTLKDILGVRLHFKDRLNQDSERQ